MPPRFVPFVCLVSVIYLPALRSEAQAGSQTAKTQQSPNETATLLVDTDDACHLFIDDEDKDQIIPDSSRKFSVTIGEHILKCKNDKIPDLVWRKVVEVKDASQVAAVVSLKALHIKYDHAVAEVKTAEGAGAKQLAEAEAEERERATAKAEFPKQFFDRVKGTWGHTSSTVGISGTIDTTLTFKDFDISRGVLTVSRESMVRAWGGMKVIVSGFLYSGYFTPSAPNQLQGAFLECSHTDGKEAKRGVVKYIPCSINDLDKPFTLEILFLNRDTFRIGDQEYTRRSQ